MNRIALPIVLVISVSSPVFAADEPTPAAIKTAISKSIPLMETAIQGHSSQRECFSCHHHAMGALVFPLARERGFAIDNDALAEDIDRGETMLKGGAEALKQGRPIGGGVTTVGYTLMSLEIGKKPANETIAAAVTFLIKNPKEGDHWRATSNRVPSEGSEFTATYLALRGLKAYGQTADRAQIDQLTARAKTWLIKNPGADTEDRVFRLHALKLAGADPSVIREATDAFVKNQRADGGWAQLDQGMESDAYATGTVLVALHQAGGLSTDDPKYRKGIIYLLKTQKPDGTWYVKSRTKVIVQKYFETGFPHGKDQFISISGTGWATAALLLSMPKVAGK